MSSAAVTVIVAAPSRQITGTTVVSVGAVVSRPSCTVMVWSAQALQLPALSCTRTDSVWAPAPVIVCRRRRLDGTAVELPLDARGA